MGKTSVMNAENETPVYDHSNLKRVEKGVGCAVQTRAQIAKESTSCTGSKPLPCPGG